MFSIIKVFDNYNNSNYREYICDDISDISSLPVDCAVGSTAFVIDGSSVYMLGNDKQWHEI